MRTLDAGWGLTVEIGTSADDRRLHAESLFVRAARDRGDIRVLTQAQALKLAGLLLETVVELQESGG